MNRKNRMILVLTLAAIAVGVGGALAISRAIGNSNTRTEKQGASASAAKEAGGAALPGVIGTAQVKSNPEREAYFGETHVHTSWSFDAYVFGNTVTTPEDAYRYAMGEPIKHPLGYEVKITTPLDWMGVTDHSEYMGVVRLSNDPESPLSKLPIADKLRVRDAADIQRIYLWLGDTVVASKPVPELVSSDVLKTVWKEYPRFADKFNKPGKFTTFASYEWTSNPDFSNMHRNIF